MNRALGVALAAVLLLAPLPALGQQAAPTDTTSAAARAPHAPHSGVDLLLRYRAELQLSDEQIARLQAVAQRLEERNRPLLEQLRAAGIPLRRERRDEVHRMTPEQRQALHEKLREHRPTLERLRENMEAAMREARAVLTPEQQERFRALLREQYRGRGDGPQRSHERRGPADRRGG